MPVVYSFTTSVGDVLTHVPIGATYLDRLRYTTDATTPVIANRIPPPRIDAQIENTVYQGPGFPLADGMTMQVLTPTSGIISSGLEPFDISDGDTLLIRIDDGYIQTITLSGLTEGAATAEEVAKSIAYQIRLANVYLDTNETELQIESQTTGTTSIVKVEGGTAATALSFDDADHPGTAGSTEITFSSGDFGDIALATAEEIVDVLNAQLPAHAWAATAADGTRIRLFTSYKRISCTGDGAEVLGLLSWARLVSGNSEPFDLEERDTLKLIVDGGIEQTIVIESTELASVEEASVEFLVQYLNLRLSGATAEASDDGTQLEIRSNTETSSSSIQVTGGSANAALGFSTTEAQGVGYGSEVIYEALATDPIKFDIFDVGSAGLDASTLVISVETDFTKTQVYDGSGPTTADGWTVTVTASRSPGESNDDILSVEMEHTTDFISDERVTVYVDVDTATPESLSATYYFAVEDTRRPSVSELISWSPRQLRLKFSEPMDQTDDVVTSSLYTRNVSGRVAYYASINVGLVDAPVWYYNVVEAPTASFTSDEVGLFLGSAGAQNAPNNFIAPILSVLSSTLVCVDTSLEDEDPADPREVTPPQVTVSPYRVTRGTQDNDNTPAFCPIVLEANALTQEEVLAGDETARYVNLVFHDDLSPSTNYDLELVTITDPSGNEIASTYNFTSWSLRNVPDRSWDLLSMIPQYNQDIDTQGDQDKFLRCLNEVAQVLLNDVDTVGDLLDPWHTKEAVVDILLETLGNPFTFARGLSVTKKRDLIPLLVPMYKKKGTEAGIEDTVLFFLGKTIYVVPWTADADTWELGTSELGFNTYVGPSKSFVRYSFTIQHPDILTDDEKTIINEIVDFAKPAHTHFVGYVKI